MKKIEEGLFAVEGAMPCSPRDIKIGRYALPSTLQRAEREEAAARILSFSQQLDRWVGVSWRRLGEMMKEEYDQLKKSDEVRDYNLEEEKRYTKAVRKYRTLCIITLGVYALFVTKPTKQLREVPDYQMPFTGIFVFGPGHVVDGIHDLVANGMLQQIDEGEGEDAFNVFFPTPKLISTIMQKQGVKTA